MKQLSRPSPGIDDGKGIPDICPTLQVISNNFENTYSNGANLTINGPGNSKSRPLCAGFSFLSILDGNNNGPSSQTYNVKNFFHPALCNAFFFNLVHHEKNPSD